MNLYDQIARNKRVSVLLIGGLLLFVPFVFYIFAQAYGYSPLGLAGFALILTGIYSLISYYASDKLVLSISGAREVSKDSARELYRLVENLCIGDGLPVPKIYIIDDSAPNAFATGRDPRHAAICFTTGLLDKLDRAELEGVAAHELSHIKNFDTRLTTLAVILVGVVAMLSDMFMRWTWWGGRRNRDDRDNSSSIFLLVGLVLALIAPLIATLIRLALSREREYLADASGAYLTRFPEGLARALEKIAGDPAPLESANNVTASMYIENPLKGNAANWLSGLFDTHPPIEERIKRLRSM